MAARYKIPIRPTAAQVEDDIQNTVIPAPAPESIANYA